MTLRNTMAVVALGLALTACASADKNDSTPAGDSKAPNFLVLIGDDMGIETLPCYGVGSATAETPTLDNLCQAGMRFDNFWAQPVCSPTRATILTGQFGFRNGVGTPANGPSISFPVPDADTNVPELGGAGGGGGRGGNRRGRVNRNTPAERPSISGDAYGLPAALKADSKLDYQTAALGKWHLANDDNGALDHPRVVGFDHYAGPFNGGGVESYYAWSKVIDGELTDGQTGYVTTNTIDDTIDWLARRDPNRPWLAWVAFNAAHSPWGVPPAELVSEETASALDDPDDLTLFRAMIEAMDTEIGRLLDEIPQEELDNTYIVFIGDNGTPGRMASAPYQRDRVKGTLYQGGINVPMIVAGPGITSGTATQALANSVDLYPTILDLAGTAADEKLDGTIIDGVSLATVLANSQASARDFAYADVFGQQRVRQMDSRTIRDEHYKLLRDRLQGTDELYHLTVDPWEESNLLNAELDSDARIAYEKLTARLAELVSSQ